MTKEELRDQINSKLGKYKSYLEKDKTIDYRDFATEEILTLIRQAVSECPVRYNKYPDNIIEQQARQDIIKLLGG